MKPALVALARLGSAAALLAGGLAAPAAPAVAAGAPYTVTTGYFQVTVGSGERCRIVGDLYRPAGAAAAAPVPAIVIAHGFGGSKDSDVASAKVFVGQGYGVLTYSALGFGGSTCRLGMDAPALDGQAGSQLVQFLGGRAGYAYADEALTTPLAPPDWVQLDRVGRDGVAREFDPRVGMFGESYGGGAQFATASVEPRVDTIVPAHTWSDLRWALYPNAARPMPLAAATIPGPVKLTYTLGFLAAGQKAAFDQFAVEPYRALGCPNWRFPTCEALYAAAATGVASRPLLDGLYASSVASYADRITAPTLLIGGEQDLLFTLDHSVNTYRMLKSRGVPVSLMWGSSGHNGPPAPGDGALTAVDENGHFYQRVLAWYARHLKGQDVSAGPAFSWFRPWVPYTGIATPAYGVAADPAPSRATTYTLSAGYRLVPAGARAWWDVQPFVTGPGALPTTLRDVDGLPDPSGTWPDLDLPGTFASWATTPLSAPVEVVGSPTLRLSLTSVAGSVNQLLGDPGRVTFYAKVFDLGPDGSRRRVGHQVAAVRVPDVTAPVTLTMPAVVHRFEPGHRIQLVLAGGDLNYRGGQLAADVLVSSGGQMLSLPTVDSQR